MKRDGTRYNGTMDYSMDVNDYISLCPSCHKKFDL